MSRKISKVTLEAFRAYEKIQNFDFSISNEEVANLIVIYAPNGSGKTSFFDAVEWVMSGKIQRISNNQRVKEIAEQEKGHILKNKESDLLNGTVEIAFTDQEHIVLNTKKIVKPRKTDYDEGKLISATSGINKDKTKEFVSKNILTHDQIDRFLRFQGSKERYETLRVFWDVNEETEIYKGLLSIIKEISNQKTDFKKTQDQITLDLNRFKLNNETMTKMNSYINMYNSYSDESQINELTNFNLETILQESVSKKTDLEKRLFAEAKKMEEVNTNFQLYKEVFPQKVREFNNLIKVNIPFILKKINNFEKISKNEIEKEKTVSKISTLTLKLNKLEFLIQNEGDYLDKVKENEKLMSNQYRLSLNRKRESENLIELHHRITKSKNALKQNNEKLFSYNEKIHKLNNVLNIKELRKELSIVEEQEKKMLKKLGEINSLITKNELQKEKELRLTTMNVQELVSSYDLTKEFSQKIKSYFSELLYYHNLQFDMEKNIKIKEEEIEAHKKIGSDISKLKKIGRDILNKSDSKNCPLCNHEYDDFNILIQNIESWNIEFQQLNSYNEELLKLKESFRSIKKTIEISQKNLNEELKNTIQKVLEENNKLKINKGILNEDCKKIISDKEKIIYELKKFETELKELNLENRNEEILLNEINKKKNTFENESETVKDAIKKESEEIKKIEIDINDSTYRKKKIEEEIKQNDILINQLNNDQIYKAYANIKMEVEDSNNNSIIEKISKLNEEKKNLGHKVSRLSREVSDIQTQLGDDNKNDIISKYEELTEEARKLELFIDFSQKEFIRVLGNENIKDVKDEYFLEKIKAISEESIMLEKQDSILSTVINTLSGYVNNTMKTDKENDLTVIKSEIRNLNKQLKNIYFLKEKSHEYIKNQIENVFNLNSVNNIFEMLNPHPDIKEIYFKLDETLKDGALGLNIMCKNNLDESEGEAPTLYLSSAQVNILSLSIFLASAIENTDVFNTILMDDPIQHLDGLNLLSFIDLIRIVCYTLDKQVIISTHDQNFFNLCQRKIDAKYFAAKYFDLSPNLNNVISES